MLGGAAAAQDRDLAVHARRDLAETSLVRRMDDDGDVGGRFDELSWLQVKVDWVPLDDERAVASGLT